MNYAPLMLGGVFLFAVIYYLVYGRRYYKGPVVETEVDKVETGEDLTKDTV
jgi:hypothetical protein